jgi:non-homologous end joining protein Ku
LEFRNLDEMPETTMARATWKGSLKLSLVTCPVLLYPASTSVEKTRFHLINRETGNRLKQQMVDAETGDIVEGEQKGRGYELQKGSYVEVEPDELDAVRIESNHSIDIDSFVPRQEIDRRYLNQPYYIAPDGKAALDAFAVIRDAMKDQDRVALARIVLTNRVARRRRRTARRDSTGRRGSLAVPSSKPNTFDQVIPGRCEASNPESRDSPMRNCASVVWC